VAELPPLFGDPALQGLADPGDQTLCLKLLFQRERVARFVTFYLSENTVQFLWALAF